MSLKGLNFFYSLKGGWIFFICAKAGFNNFRVTEQIFPPVLSGLSLMRMKAYMLHYWLPAR